MKKRFRYTFLLLIYVVLLISACVKREWYNPFDPACPKELWTPTNFQAVQEGDLVKLTWVRPTANISGFKIIRQVDDGPAVSLTNQAKDVIELKDGNLTGGKVHTYSITAFAGNNESNAVSIQVKPLFIPSFSTSTLTSIASTTVAISNTISSDGGAPVTARGVCWSSNPNPTINDNKTDDGNGAGIYSSTINGLSPGSIYNIRAYATNSVGVAYSNQIATTTNAILSTITTAEVSSIGSVIASCGGTITSDGGATVTERGVCWNTTGNPTVADAKTNNGSGTGNFTSAITGLIPGTNYYVRAYSVNRIGTTYGNTMLFKTLAILPIVTTGILNPLSPTTASCSGNISYDGGAPVTARGVCWSTAANPTVSDSKTNEGSGSGDFVSSITGLAPEITYYARAYAVNSAGTSYGNTLQLKTSAVLPTITTTTPTLLTNETVSCGGNISSDGGAVVSARGVCWSTSHNPTTADSKSSEGVGIGSFSILITNLTQGLTYYIRSYATNSKGTAYGNEVIVVASLTPIITTSDPLFIKTTFFQAGGNVVFDGASPIAMRGVCWSTNPTPTISNAHTNDGNGSGIFSSSPSGLTPNTLYYVRAYATNYFGTTYGNEISVVTSYGEVTDADGNVYQTIKIGNQIWTRENLKTTKYNDGMPIDNNIGTTVTGAYCWYNNDINNKDTYGALYNAYTIATNKLAPIGWHVATSEEWSILLSNTIGNERLKESGTKHWVAPNLGNNLTGFSAVPGGKREPNLGYLYMGTQAVWWTSTVSYFGHDALFLDSYNKVIQGSTINSMGASVRCIMGTVSLPVVSMNPYHYDVRPTSATVNFTVTELGGPTITTTGVCWSSTNYLPTIADNKTSVAKIASANYYLELTGLIPETTYFCRAYATNSDGTTYSSIFTFLTQSENIHFNTALSYGSVTDVDGNSYKTIEIGSQTWFAENLKTTKYNDGTSIPFVSDQTAWVNSTSGAYCFYNDNASLKNVCGTIYNWYTVETGKLCPAGWHVPLLDEWKLLSNTVGGDNIAGNKLRESSRWHWIMGASNGTNSSGFTAIPSGQRLKDGSFINDYNQIATFWSSTSSPSYDRNFEIYYETDIPVYNGGDNSSGYYVRCLKN